MTLFYLKILELELVLRKNDKDMFLKESKKNFAKMELLLTEGHILLNIHLSGSLRHQKYDKIAFSSILLYFHRQ